MVTAAPRHRGIIVRHRSGCAAGEGGACRCRPGYEAWAWSRRDEKKLRRTFPTLAAARAWRADAEVALRRRTLRAPQPTTVREAGEAWLAGAKEGTIRTRSGHRYKPSALLRYEMALRQQVFPELGARRLSDLQRLDLQDLADRLLAEGLAPGSVRNALMPLRTILRRAVTRGDLAVNASTGLELPASQGRRERIATPAEAAKLLEALPPPDQALWATALYTGLRRGELQALPWEDVDLTAGLLRVERAFDDKARVYVEPKSAAGRRSVPIPSDLRKRLREHRLATGRSSGLVFGTTAERPFTPSTVTRRARTAWKKAGLAPLGFHEARHTFASFAIAAGVNAKALSTYMGHASVTITYDRYGHLMPGNEAQAAGLLDAYLSAANG